MIQPTNTTTLQWKSPVQMSADEDHDDSDENNEGSSEATAIRTGWR
jgi:hypothetical protein